MTSRAGTVDQDLIPANAPVAKTEVRADDTGVNLFLEIQMKDG